MRHLPNLICLGRIVLIWPLVLALQNGAYGMALLLFALAAASDALDGFLAKRFSWTSEFGKVLDPVADKLLLVITFIVGAWLGLIPVWLTAAAVARDVMIGLGALVFRLCFGPLHGRPTILSKINTAMQAIYVLAVIAHAAGGRPAPWVPRTLAVLTLVTIVLSGAHYIIEFTRRAWKPQPAG